MVKINCKIKIRHSALCLILSFLSCSYKNEDGQKKQSRIAFVVENKVCLINENGGAFKVLNKDFQNPILPKWSNDGSKIIFMSSTETASEIILIDTIGKVLNRIKPKLNFFCYPSLVNENIVVEGIADAILNAENHELFLLNYGGEVVKKITSNNKLNINPNIYSNGNKLVYVEREGDESNTYEIYIQDIDNRTERKKITDNNNVDKFPAISPDGNLVAFLTSSSEAAEIWIMNVDGSKKRKVMSDGYGLVSWSPDSKKIVMESPDEGLIIVNIEDTSKKVFLNNEAILHAYFPAWSPF